MKHYSKPIVESIEVKSADFLMQLSGSPEHGQSSSAPKRKQKEPSF